MMANWNLNEKDLVRHLDGQFCKSSVFSRNQGAKELASYSAKVEKKVAAELSMSISSIWYPNLKMDPTCVQKSSVW